MCLFVPISQRLSHQKVEKEKHYHPPQKGDRYPLTECFIFPGLIFLYIYKLIYLFLAALGLHCCAQAFSSCGEAGATLRYGAWASHCSGFSCCKAQALGTRASVVVAHEFSSCGSRAQLLRSMWESSRTRDRTCVPCIDRWILNHCATREVPPGLFLSVLLGSETGDLLKMISVVGICVQVSQITKSMQIILWESHPCLQKKQKGNKTLCRKG